MKKALLIIMVLLIGAFFLFFKVETNDKLEFLDAYKNEIGFTSYEAEQIISTVPSEEGLRITFNQCNIDSANMKSFQGLSKEIGIELNNKVNAQGDFRNVIFVFKPKNSEGIRLSDLVTIEELKFSYKADEL